MQPQQIQFFRSIFLLLTILIIGCTSNTQHQIPTQKVEKGEFVISITETGELEAVSSKVIAAPRISWRFGQLKVIKIVEDGSEVKESDELIKFDEAEVQKAIVDKKAELEIAKAELKKKIADQNSTIEDLEADLEIAELSYQISELELEQASYEADIKKREIQLSLKQAKINLEKARQEIQNQKKIHIQEQKKLDLKIKQLKNNLQDANDALAKLIVRAPSPGIAIIKENWWSGNKYQVGDQPYAGWPMIGLPDLNKIQVLTEINEVDIAKIKLDQKVKIKLDAYPDTSFSGKVIEIATLAHEKDKDSKAKVFDVLVLIDGASKILMPGMTVSCEIIVDKIPDVLYMPLEALFKKDGESIAYVGKGSSFKPHILKLGLENRNFVIIEDGLKQGQTVALLDPTELQASSGKKEGAKQ